MTVRVGVNGFGRIGRNFYRAVLAQGADVEFVAVNDLGSLDQMATFEVRLGDGSLDQNVKVVKGGIKVGNHTIRVLSERDPKALPWGDLGVDVVVESTGIFTDRESCNAS